MNLTSIHYLQLIPGRANKYEKDIMEYWVETKTWGTMTICEVDTITEEI